MTLQTCSEILVDGLIQMGTRHVYGMIGTSILGFFDGLYSQQDKIRYISCRHEQVAVSMADTEGRLTQKPGVAIVHAGAGALNGIISVANAYKDCSPLLLISGGVKSRLKGLDGWLEVDQKTIFGPITKGYFRVEAVGDIPQILSQAYQKMMEGAKGPVVIEIPEDLWKEKEECEAHFAFETPLNKKPTDNDVQKIIEALTRAKQPLILAGFGVYSSGAINAFVQFVEKYQLPVVTTGNARGVIPEDHPLCIGRVGFGGGSQAADNIFEKADLILGLGASLSDVSTYDYTLESPADIYLVNLDHNSGEKPYPIEAHILADTGETLKQLSVMPTTARADWLEEVAAAKKSWQDQLSDAAENPGTENLISPSYVFAKLSTKLPRNLITTGGAGLHVVYPNDYLPALRPVGYLSSTNFGAMGFAFAAGLGAKLAESDACVIAVLGDGDFMMTVQDIETAVREKIGLKIIIVNDSSYRVLMVKQKIQHQNRVMGTSHNNPDFMLLAQSFGIKGIQIKSPTGIEERLDEFVKTKECVLLEIVVDPDNIPPTNLQAALKMGQL